jgi:hypothetical protein
MEASKVIQRFRISLDKKFSSTLFFSIERIHQAQSNSKLTDFKVALTLSRINGKKWIIDSAFGANAECILQRQNVIALE